MQLEFGKQNCYPHVNISNGNSSNSSNPRQKTSSLSSRRNGRPMLFEIRVRSLNRSPRGEKCFSGVRRKSKWVPKLCSSRTMLVNSIEPSLKKTCDEKDAKDPPSRTDRRTASSFLPRPVVAEPRGSHAHSAGELYVAPT